MWPRVEVGRLHPICCARWLLKRLEARKDIWAIFPPSWHVPQLLCIMFCNITKTMLAEILDLKVRAWESQRIACCG